MKKLLLTAGLLCGAAVAAAQTFVLENFTLIDGSGGKPLPNAAMIVKDGRIQWLGMKSRLKAPAGAQSTDLSGKYVMPGIINLHAHLGNTVDLEQDPKNFTRENVEKQLKVYASYGITAVVSMGSDQDLIFPIRSEQRSGRPAMTRIFTAGRGFTGVNGYPTTAPGMKGVPYEISSADEVRKDVDELAGKKVDLVKMWVDDHLGKDKKIPLDLAKKIIEDGHRHRLKVAAHVFYLDDAKTLVDAGLDELAHSVRDKMVDDGLIAAMKKRGTYQLATLTREASTFVFAKPGPVLDDPFFKLAVSPKMLATLKNPEFQKKVAANPDAEHGPSWLDMAKKNLKKLADAGVNIGFGTDTGPPQRIQGYFEHWEMELMTEAGLTPTQILTAATKNSAEFLGVSKDLGTLRDGKWADMIVLGKDPLQDIKNTRSIEAVYIAGNKVR